MYKQISLLIILLIVLTLTVHAEHPVNTEDKREVVGIAINSWDSVSPIYYFKQGYFGYGFLMILLWIVILGGCTILILITLMKSIKIKKTK